MRYRRIRIRRSAAPYAAKKCRLTAGTIMMRMNNYYYVQMELLQYQELGRLEGDGNKNANSMESLRVYFIL